MQETIPPLVWTTAPDRRFSDIVSPDASRDGEKVREALRIGLNTLGQEPQTGLILPPRKAFSPKRIAGGKNLHCHRFAEIGIVTQGEMTIWWEGTTTRCPVGSVFVIPPGTRYLPHYSATDTPSQPHSIAWLALHRGCGVAHLCALEGRTHHLGEYYCFTETQVLGQTRSLVQELADRPIYFEQVIRGCLLCLLTWLLRAPVYSITRQDAGVPRQLPEETNPFQERVESYFLSNYHRPVTLLQVARSLGCSPAYLCRQFRKLSGQTPFQYLRTVRIDAAKRLLQSEVPVGRVAEMVGFDDPLYFSKVFSRQTGVSPQNYRVQKK